MWTALKKIWNILETIKTTLKISLNTLKSVKIILETVWNILEYAKITLETAKKILEVIWNILEYAKKDIESHLKDIAICWKAIVKYSVKIGGIIMLVFNPRRIFALRGVEKPSAFLARQGIAPSTAIKFMKAQSSMFKISYVEMICVTMNCTPNDLFDWKPDAKTNLPENHPLRALERTEKIKNIRELLHDLPVEKLSQIENLVNELKNSE